MWTIQKFYLNIEYYCTIKTVTVKSNELHGHQSEQLASQTSVSVVSILSALHWSEINAKYGHTVLQHSWQV
jgi:hypothetical protein